LARLDFIAGSRDSGDHCGGSAKSFLLINLVWIGPANVIFPCRDFMGLAVLSFAGLADVPNFLAGTRTIAGLYSGVSSFLQTFGVNAGCCSSPPTNFPPWFPGQPGSCKSATQQDHCDSAEKSRLGQCVKRAGSLAHGLAVDPSGTESQISQANIVRRTNEDAGVFHSVFRNLGTPTNTTVTTALDGRGGFGERCVRLIPVSAASRDQKAQNTRTDMALSASV